MVNYGLNGSFLKHDDVLYLPDEPGAWGNTSIRFHVEMQKPNIIISLMDWFVYDTTQWNRNGVPWINWTPIDLHIDPTFDRLQTYLKDSFGIVTTSQFGYDELKKSGREPTGMIHHAIDSNVFKILDKVECKKAIGFKDDNFVIGMNMANKDASEDRKAFGQQFKAVKKFINKHPKDNIVLYINSEPSAKYNGHNLIELLKNNNFDLDKVIFTNPAKLNTYPSSPEEMAILYNSFDVLMNASCGEGFGVPIIEAQACGVPVLTHDDTSMPEITFYGYAAKSNKKSQIDVTGYGHRFHPDVNDMVKGLEYIFNNRDEKRSEEISLVVRKMFDIDRIGLQWMNLIRSVM